MTSGPQLAADPIAAQREAQRAEELTAARLALRYWREAVQGDSADAEYGAACAMEHALDTLVRRLS